jgi:hypothetical protein
MRRLVFSVLNPADCWDRFFAITFPDHVNNLELAILVPG